MSNKIFKILIVFLFLFVVKASFATHYLAGEILYEYLGPLTYRATLISYTENNSATDSQDTIYLDWGDGTVESVARTNGPIGSSGVPSGEDIPNTTFVKNVYISNAHTYPGALPYYVIFFTDENRKDGITNMSNSVDVPIYLEDTLKYIPPELFEGNSSPLLLNAPIDYANVLDTFYHNPNAFDPDGDSLYYQLMPSLQSLNSEVPGYLFPDQYPAGPNNNISINALTGELIWATPQTPGFYNVAILIKEYRNGQNIGTLFRDMLIIVANENNDPPQIRNIVDTCVYAGDTLAINILATDPNSLDVVTLSAQGGPFEISPSRVSFNTTDGNPALANFQWRTICTDIRPQFYEIVIKAEDDYTKVGGTPLHLVDLETWLIHVVAPPPDSLYATVTGNDVQLNWDNPYSCYDSPDFQYFSVWRRYGCENIDRVACETGLANTDYEMIADNLHTYSYLDQDVDRGHIYSYRIVAHFGKNPQSANGAVFNKSQSIPSHEVCVELPLDLPVITNVSVAQTSTTDGIMFIQWSKPRAGAGLVDTLQDVGPYSYELYRSEGFVGTSFSLVETFVSNSFQAFNDTLYYDSLLNTLEMPYSYKVIFKANNGIDEMGETSVASSVFLTIGISDKSLNLKWEENVPWVNEEYTIYKQNKTTLLFDSIAITNKHVYKDTGLENDSTYCYKIRSKGKYTVTGLINPIINFSEETCGTPKDTIAPCPPKVFINNDCETISEIWEEENYQNRLSWNIDKCLEDAVLFKIYYRAMGATSFVLLDETTDTSYVHQLTNTIAGCYYVEAIDDAGNISKNKDTVCVENCAQYVLPNVFTPNNDGDNDLFTPFPTWRFVEKVDLKIYGRWGNLVFETQNPAILWDGTDVSKQALKDGIYFYSGFYYVRKLDGSLDKIVLPPNKKGGGFVHLINGK